MTANPEIYDILIIGGGINGCGIARDASGRGMKVALVEMNDLASGTSSASTKLIHGGLRYLEQFEFRLVKESLKEREVLLKAMPHIARPLRFVLPLHPDMQFEENTPASKLLANLFPWMKGKRPSWLIRLGLALYDYLADGQILPGTRSVDLTHDPSGKPLKDTFRKAFEYSDCWVDDARLVVLNARDAHDRGANIMTGTKVLKATARGGEWEVELSNSGKLESVKAKILINAAGPWAETVIAMTKPEHYQKRIRLVRGSHIVTKQLFDHEKCYIFQGSDSRIIFAIPYETNFTLVGTTDQNHGDIKTKPYCTDSEKNYLLTAATQYFKFPLSESDIVWTYSGVRPLLDDGSTSASKITRDYKIEQSDTNGSPIINVLGGKLTTHRKLSETVVDKIVPILENKSKPWTHGFPLPGGDFPYHQVHKLLEELKNQFGFLTEEWATRLVRAYGTDARIMLNGTKAIEDLGRDFGSTITSTELDWVIAKEWVRCAEDFLWRRSKLGLRVLPEQVKEIDSYISKALISN